MLTAAFNFIEITFELGVLDVTAHALSIHLFLLLQ